ncbi:MAG TPA: mercuric transporter MerT family protein [Gemmatimonadales bacterium]
MIGKVAGTAAAAIASAFTASLCCAGPFLAAAGISGAATLGTGVEPLRPYLLGAAGGFVGVGHVIVRREDRKACTPGTPCATPVARRNMKRTVWGASALVVVLATFPTWSVWFLG